MKTVRQRIEQAMRRETGVRLTAAEVHGIAAKLGIEIGTDNSGSTQSHCHERPEKQDAINVHIRWMIRSDMPDVLGIENESFRFPWPEEAFIRCLRQRNCIGMVAEHDERVVGFMLYELHKDRLHLLNLAVAVQHRSKSVGRQMTEKLIGKLSAERRNRIEVEVADFNLAGQCFLSAVGFRAVGIEPDWYANPTADAIQFEHRFDGNYEFRKQRQENSTWVDSCGDDDEMLPS